MKNKLLIIYNICGISGKDNTDYYIKALENLLSQTINSPIIVSACCPLPHTIEQLKIRFQQKISINVINDQIPVNITFNYSVNKAIEKYGKADGYSYIDSGIIFNQQDALEKMHNKLLTSKYGIVSCVTDNDNGFSRWGINHNSDEYIIPVGKAINGHTEIFDNSLLEFYGKLMPDIFASFCTESTYSFLVAALQKQWLLCTNSTALHVNGMDIGSSFCHNDRPNIKCDWDHLFSTNRSMKNIISDHVGIELGFGYEEVQSVLMHKKECYDENGLCKNNELKYWIKNNIFLSKEEFNYDNINSEWIN